MNFIPGEVYKSKSGLLLILENRGGSLDGRGLKFVKAFIIKCETSPWSNHRAGNVQMCRLYLEDWEVAKENYD